MCIFLQTHIGRCFSEFDRAFSKAEPLYISIGSWMANDLSNGVHVFSQAASLAEHMTWSISSVDTVFCRPVLSAFCLFRMVPLAAIMQMTLPPEKRTRKGVPRGLIRHSELRCGAGRVVMWRWLECSPLTAVTGGWVAPRPPFPLLVHLSNHRWALWEMIQGRSSIRRVRTRGKCHFGDMENLSPQRPLTAGRY